MKRIPFLTIAALAVLVPTARGQDPPANSPDRAERRQRVIAAFDADGDGQLNDDERENARQELSDAGDRPGRPEGRGPRPDGPPEPGKMFDRFDENKDGQLSRDEFTKLTHALREMRERFGRGPGGRGREARGDRPGPSPGPPPGPPEDGGDRPPRRRGGGEDFRPLENPGPPPREEERGYRGREDDRGARDGRDERRGPDRMGPPNPERLFSAFDANHDDQLSREEFIELSRTVHERMADFRGRGGPPEGGRHGRHHRPGPPDGPPGPPRPPRPDFESSVSPKPDVEVAIDGNAA